MAELVRLSRDLYDRYDRVERVIGNGWVQGGRAMAVLLDGDRLRSQTRTERLVQTITLEAVLRYAPVASIAGVPLAVLSARQYAVGYASHLGIPGEFVKAEPTAAFVPFVFITTVLLSMLLVLHEVERLGVAQAMQTWGSVARFYFFLFGVTFYAGWALRSPAEIPELAASAVVLYLMLWWLPPFIAWTWRHTVGWAWKEALRKLGKTLPGSGRLWNSLPQALRKLCLALIVLVSVVIVPRELGVWMATTNTEYTVVDRGKNHTEAILEVYGDKAFIGWVEDDAVARVEMVAVSDLENKPLWIQDIGPLKFVEGD